MVDGFGWLRGVAIVIVASFAIMVFVPRIGLPILRDIVAASNVLILFGSAIVLIYFVYRIYLRRVWRARHIANLRLKRLLAEKEAEEDRGEQ
jgi:hypothetical protein